MKIDKNNIWIGLEFRLSTLRVSLCRWLFRASALSREKIVLNDTFNPRYSKVPKAPDKAVSINFFRGVQDMYIEILLDLGFDSWLDRKN